MGDALQEANYFDGKEVQDAYILIGSQGVGGSTVKCNSRMGQSPGRAGSNHRGWGVREPRLETSKYSLSTSCFV